MAAVRYFVTDLDAALAFYRDHFAFDEIVRFGSAFARIERDGLEIWLSGPDTSAARSMPDGRIPEPGGWNRIVITVEGLEERAKELARAGVRFRNRPFSGPGGTQVLIEDPDGNPIELFEPR